jgi:carboxymethylenebutenolidase
MPITSQRIEIQTPDGRMPAHLALPAAPGRHPAVIVYAEAFGLNDNIRKIAERIAAEGYVALAPDPYYRLLPAKNCWTYDSVDGAVDAMQSLTDARFAADSQAALDYLASRSDTTGKVGVTGFCMGGRLSFLAACTHPERIAAAAPFYGGGIVGLLDRAPRLRAPVLQLYGEKDPYIPLDQVERIKAELARLSKRSETIVYPGADHGFFCEERASYQAQAAGDAWKRVKSFFSEHLR